MGTTKNLTGSVVYYDTIQGMVNVHERVTWVTCSWTSRGADETTEIYEGGRDSIYIIII